ncbi:MAG TPA: hypothetical protein VFB84_03135 [Micromonosporaceae bacterium]|nr:hypothetical protein [Micromonosporaceae bacterium]
MPAHASHEHLIGGWSQARSRPVPARTPELAHPVRRSHRARQVRA